MVEGHVIRQFSRGAGDAQTKYRAGRLFVYGEVCFRAFHLKLMAMMMMRRRVGEVERLMVDDGCDWEISIRCIKL